LKSEDKLSDIDTVLAVLISAKSYLDVFGRCENGDPAAHLKKEYRRLARGIHPDHYRDEGEKKKATEAFQLLTAFYDEGMEAAEKDRYNELPSITIKTRRHEFQFGAKAAAGDICDLYFGTVKGAEEDLFFKVARVPRDNDLLEAEASALRYLTESDTEKKYVAFFPELVESFAFKDEKGQVRRANALKKLSGWYSLTQVREKYLRGINPLDMVWIWRRLLWILGYIHPQNILQGALLPPHILIQPEQHGLIVCDWCYSARRETDSVFPAIKAVVPGFKDWYPEEVLKKEAPTFGTDIYLAVKSMQYVLGGDPKGNLGVEVPRGIRAFFNGCTQKHQKTRPQDAWELLKEFDELLERMGKPYYPKRFHRFSM